MSTNLKRICDSAIVLWVTKIVSVCFNLNLDNGIINENSVISYSMCIVGV